MVTENQELFPVKETNPTWKKHLDKKEPVTV